MNKIALIATGLLVATSAAASAHDIDATRDRQADRIEQGRETGRITWTSDAFRDSSASSLLVSR